MLILFLLFAVLPIAEIMLLINVSGTIGGWNTFFIVVISAAIGAFFVKREGIHTLQKVQQKTATGELPGKEISEGLLLLVAGVLLVTPGFITDIVGLLFTLPFTRAPIAAWLIKHFVARQGQAGAAQFHFYHQRSQSQYQHSRQNENNGDIIDGEYKEKTDKDRLK